MRDNSSHNPHPAIFIVVAIVLAILDVWLLFWVPTAERSSLAVPAVTFFLLVVLFAVVSQRMSKKLVQEMKRPVAIQVETQSVASTVASAAPPLRVEIFTSDNLPPPSPQGEELVQRSRQIFFRTVAVHRKMAWTLGAANLALSFVGFSMGPTSARLGSFMVYLALATLLLQVVVNPKRSQNSLTYVVWFVLHFLWLGATIVAAGIYIAGIPFVIRRGSFHFSALIPFLLIVLVLGIYVWHLRRSIDHLRREVLSYPSLQLLFLWVFGPFERLNSLFLGFGALWRCLGSLQLLQGGAVIGVGGDVFRYLRGRGRTGQIIAATPEQAEARISAFPQQPHRWWSLYATNMLLCSDQSWRFALGRLLRQTELVLMDLSMFSKENQGCSYEIGQLIDKIDAFRFLLLVDETTDIEFLQTSLETAWSEMAADSPNRRPECGPIRLFRLGQEYVVQQGNQSTVALAAVQKDARCVMQLLCEGATKLQNYTARPS